MEASQNSKKNTQQQKTTVYIEIYRRIYKSTRDDKTIVNDILSLNR